MRLFITIGLILCCYTAFSQPMDTTRIDVGEFIQRAKSESSYLRAQKQQVDLAQNRVSQARAMRIAPRLELSTAHGLVPAVRTSDPASFSRGSYYLDPNLSNDWTDWAVFTRAEVTTLQPLFTWGAINNAIKAAREGANAAHAEFMAQTASFELRLLELYYTKLLTMELKRLADDAQRTLDKAEEQLDKLLEEGDESITDADIFQFRIFKYEFAVRVDEIEESIYFVDAAWNLALNNHTPHHIYLPAEQFLDPVEAEFYDVMYYESIASRGRPEIMQIESVYRAATYGLEISKSQNYPSLFMGLSAAFARTPNRPRQSNPFINNTTNYESLAYGIGFRQNLNFGVNRIHIDRSKAQVRQAMYAREAVEDGIRLEIRERYRNMMMSYSRLNNTRGALDVSKEWLRMEQIDYDLGFGEVKDLIDALRANLELEVSYRQRIFDFNVNLGRLNSASGLPIVH